MAGIVWIKYIYNFEEFWILIGILLQLNCQIYDSFQNNFNIITIDNIDRVENEVR